ncbi:MAG: hypothetical protein R2755_26850 [Acidimicrobiales bacterium]
MGVAAADMTGEHDRADLARHEREIERHEPFNDALFDRDETALLGCVYIDPPVKAGTCAEVCWWAIDDLVGSDVEAALAAVLPAWLAADWPFERVRYRGIDLAGHDWLALPDR